MKLELISFEMILIAGIVYYLKSSGHCFKKNMTVFIRRCRWLEGNVVNVHTEKITAESYPLIAEQF